MRNQQANEGKSNENRLGGKATQWNGGKAPLEGKYYDNADMARLFKVSSRTLQRWRKGGDIPFRKIRGKIFYVAEEIDRFMRGAL